MNGGTYLCGAGSEGYLQPQRFADAELNLVFQNFREDARPQLGTSEFIKKSMAGLRGQPDSNIQDFWKSCLSSEVLLEDVAYDDSKQFGLFGRSLFISESEWTRWNGYSNGKLLHGDRRSLLEHLEKAPPLVYLLIYPETFFEVHPYE